MQNHLSKKGTRHIDTERELPRVVKVRSIAPSPMWLLKLCHIIGKSLWIFSNAPQTDWMDIFSSTGHNEHGKGTKTNEYIWKSPTHVFLLWWFGHALRVNDRVVYISWSTTWFVKRVKSWKSFWEDVETSCTAPENEITPCQHVPKIQTTEGFGADYFHCWAKPKTKGKDQLSSIPSRKIN